MIRKWLSYFRDLILYPDLPPGSSKLFLGATRLRTKLRKQVIHDVFAILPAKERPGLIFLETCK
ncbi:hypothetical protein C0J52_07221 [Blattella germanica]|nr:hypothetical protein C0J52_07221 [Blattella germanica]